MPGAFPGDVVHVTQAKKKKSFAEATQAQITHPSPDRIEPICPDAQRCGGCDWMALPIERQRERKREVLADTLHRLGGISRDFLERQLTVLGGQPLSYRMRVRLQIKRGKVGFFARGTHEVVEVRHCAVCPPPLWRAVTRFRELLSRHPAVEGLEGVEIRRLPEKKESSVYLFVERAALNERALRSLVRALEKEYLVGVQGQVPEPAEQYFLTESVYALVPLGGFLQVHDSINRQLVAEVLSLARETGAQRALDVFCGCGNFTLPLLHQGVDTTGIEVEGPAIEAAQRAAEEQGLGGTFLAQEAEIGLRELSAPSLRKGRAPQGRPEAGASNGHRYDFVVVDPPRRGAKEIVELLERLCSRTLVMISCDPPTLGRDLKALQARGWSVQRVLAFDMFPQTHHIETLSVLSPPHFQEPDPRG